MPVPEIIFLPPTYASAETEPAEANDAKAAERCIFDESLVVQQKLAETIRYKNEADRTRALGAISLTRQTLRLHKELRHCWDDCKGTPNCSIRDWVMSSRSAAANVWRPEEFPADLGAGSAVLERTKESGRRTISIPTGFAGSRSGQKPNSE